MKYNRIFMTLAMMILSLSLLVSVGCSNSADNESTNGELNEKAPNQAAALGDAKVNQSGSEFRIISMSEDRIVLSYRPSLKMVEEQLQGQVFTRLLGDKPSLFGEIGAPAIPIETKMVAVPVGATIKVAGSANMIQETDQVLVMPMQPASPDVGELPPFTFNEKAYESETLTPESLAFSGKKMRLRGVDIVPVHIAGAQYNPKEKRLSTFDEVTVTISFEDGKGFYYERPELRTKSYETMLKNMVVNYDLIEPVEESRINEKSGADIATGCQFLIITDPTFTTAAQDLADWKILTGMTTEVVTTAVTGTTSSAIQTYIQNAYDNWTIPVEYVLFVGDAEFIPPNYVTTHSYPGQGVQGTDLYYGTVDGSDLLADIGLGRLSVDTLTEAENRIDAIIQYQRNPPSTSAFYSTATIAAYFQDYDDYNNEADRRFCLTSEEAYQYLNNVETSLGITANRLYYTLPAVTPLYWNQSSYYWFASWFTGAPLNLSDYNIVSDLLRSNGFAWDADDADITAAVNAGTFLLTHRDHGSMFSWGEPYYSITEVAALTNGDLLPVVFSMNCQTGWFDNETDDVSCGTTDTEIHFAETWERNASGGAAGLIAATRVSYSGHNDVLFWGYMDAIFPNYVSYYGTSSAVYKMGDVLNYGKVLYTTIYVSSGLTYTLEMEMFHWFGDPTMEIWTDEPATMVVSHASQVDTGTASIDVNVDVDGALVAIVQDGEILGTAYSSGGDATVTLSSSISSLSTIYVTVTKHNYNPYEGTISVNYVDVDLSGFDVACRNGNMEISWNTSHESDMAGWNLMRSRVLGEMGTVYEAINGSLIPPYQYQYDYLDEDVSQGQYCYRLESVDLSGEKEYFGPVCASCE